MVLVANCMEDRLHGRKARVAKSYAAQFYGLSAPPRAPFDGSGYIAPNLEGGGPRPDAARDSLRIGGNLCGFGAIPGVGKERASAHNYLLHLLRVCRLCGHEKARELCIIFTSK